ncbi:MAG: polysaccharide deacetylase family protein [Candidatus Rokubacteria bacterium]|nr:polysaccharide deacetylase family protein [Candidatus Rokubacteria bacterium]
MPLVVCYHRVVEHFDPDERTVMPAMLISRGVLERHLDWIGLRFRFISLDELGSRLESGEPFDGPVAAVTFDDGYSDVYENAFPILKRKGIPAAFFVITDLIGTSRLPVYDRLYLLLAERFAKWGSVMSRTPGPRASGKRASPRGTVPTCLGESPVGVLGALLDALSQSEIERVIEALEAGCEVDQRGLDGARPASWEMVAEMCRAGMTIGSHTRSHVLLPNEHEEKVLEEIAGSRRELESRLGVPVNHFAYPSGRFNAAVVRAVAARGYRFGYTVCRHRDDRYPLLTIPRRVLWENSCLDGRGLFSPAIMHCQAHGLFDHFAPACEQDHGWPNGQTGASRVVLDLGPAGG